MDRIDSAIFIGHITKYIEEKCVEMDVSPEELLELLPALNHVLFKFAKWESTKPVPFNQAREITINEKT